MIAHRPKWLLQHTSSLVNMIDRTPPKVVVAAELTCDLTPLEDITQKVVLLFGLSFLIPMSKSNI